MAATVVAHSRLDRFGDLVEAPQQILNGLCRELFVPIEGLVQVGNIGGVVFGVMDLHRAGIDVRFEGVVSVGEVGYLMHLRLLSRWFLGGRRSSLPAHRCVDIRAALCHGSGFVCSDGLAAGETPRARTRESR